jgi:pimeloyl-ACP methyl ester carboxylesterase
MAEDADAEAGFEGKTFTAGDGLSLYYRDYGWRRSGRPALLCLPGLARNSKDFHGVALGSGERRVLAPDYRGRGRSAWDRNWRHYRPTTYLDDIRHLIAVSGVGRIVVLGTSLGGAIAMALGVSEPTRLAGVILNDIGPEIGGAGVARILRYIAQDRPQPDWPSAARHLQGLLPSLGIADAAGWLRFARATYREGADGLLHFDWDPAIVRPLLTEKPEPVDLWALFGSLRDVPVLLIRGSASDVLSAATAARMAEANPGMAELSLAGIGHAPTLEEPEAAAAIAAFLSRL